MSLSFTVVKSANSAVSYRGSFNSCRSNSARSRWNNKEQPFVPYSISFLDLHGSSVHFQTVLQQILSSHVKHIPGACVFWSCLVHTKISILCRNLLVDGLSRLQQTDTSRNYCLDCLHFDRLQKMEEESCHDNKHH